MLIFPAERSYIASQKTRSRASPKRSSQRSESFPITSPEITPTTHVCSQSSPSYLQRSRAQHLLLILRRLMGTLRISHLGLPPKRRGVSCMTRSGGLKLLGTDGGK